MAGPQATSHPRMAALRFDLEGVVIDGSLNSFKNPQLVLKTQHGQAPRVPYTGIRSRLSARRHILMVHVKDKATELVGFSKTWEFLESLLTDGHP